MSPLGEFGLVCRQSLQHLLAILPAGALYFSGVALGIGQDQHLLVVVIPIWASAAAIVALLHGAALQAANFGHIIIFLAAVSTLTCIQTRTSGSSLGEDLTLWLRHYLMANSMVAAAVAAASPMPRHGPEHEPLLVERTNPQALPADSKSLASLPGLRTKVVQHPRQSLSDIGSNAFANMGPPSSGPTCPSEVTELTLNPVGQANGAFAQNVVSLVARIEKPAQVRLGDDYSNQPQADV